MLTKTKRVFGALSSKIFFSVELRWNPAAGRTKSGLLLEVLVSISPSDFPLLEYFSNFEVQLFLFAYFRFCCS